MFVSTLVDTTTGVRYESMPQEVLWEIVRLTVVQAQSNE